jgi:hypothetical protein
MSFSLYDVTVPNYLQITAAVAGLLDTAISYSTEQNITEADILQAKLAEDMLPFAYQLCAVGSHSIGAIDGVRKGLFTPDLTPPPESFAALKQRLDDNLTALRELKPGEINSLAGGDMRFEFGDYKVDFTAENFLLSFSQPNFYFHATTAYDILRMKGVPLGKSQFIGQLRTK